ncbi:ComEC family competence protein [Bremerella volcania]|uniref:ComEC family competence protein n=1 Tax=Bremerella volcania TaxID=2527984 RepID=A0A518C5K2_9BACT|nr:DNA internalization-related competence protein ComEC/Rec2 [Bremerella volcania]QDU74506.1 ComEC family competence protein [Bremerella volcania]
MTFQQSSQAIRERTIYRPLVLLAPAITLGVIGDAAFDFSMALWLISFAGLMLLWGLLCFRRAENYASVTLLLAVAAFGGMLHHGHWNLYRSTELSRGLSADKQPVALQGVVVDYPRFLPAKPPTSAFEFELPNQWKVPFRIQQIRSGATWVAASGDTEIYVSGDQLDVRPGESILVFAQATCSEGALNPGEFDFANWARANRRRTFLRSGYPDCLQATGAPTKWSPWDPIREARHYVSGELAAAIPPGLDGLAETIFLGRRERLADETDEAFRQTGTVHLLALSGLHLGILALFAYGVLRFLPGPLWLPPFCLLLMTSAYVILVDARPPIVRASILVGAFCVAMIVYRRPTFWNSLAAAWILVICWNPTEIFQAGTQLSFVAVASLAWLAGFQAMTRQADPLQDLIEMTRPWPVKCWRHSVRWFGRMFVASLVVWLVTLPLVLFHFHAASPWTIVLSPILILPMGLALALTLLLLAASIAVPLATPWVAWLLSWPLWGMQETVAWTQQHAGLTIWSAGPPAWWVVGFYVVTATIGWLMITRRLPVRWSIAVVALWLTVGFGWGTAQAIQSSARDDLVCTFVSVGHGTCVLVELPEGRNLLYDCGRLGSPKRAGESLSAVLWSKGIQHLDAVIISHDDADHYNGLPEVLERFSVGAVYCSDLMEKIPSELVSTLLMDIRQREIPLRTLSAGRSLQAHPDVDLTILHPTRKGVLGRDNANSIVLLIEYQGRRILLPGDLESPGTEAVIVERPIDCDVVMAPHHGSRHSHAESFYQWCQPEWIVVSSGSRDILGPEDARLGEPVWLNTAASGRVEVRLSASGRPPKVASWRKAGVE